MPGQGNNGGLGDVRRGDSGDHVTGSRGGNVLMSHGGLEGMATDRRFDSALRAFD